ncbi:hypothetical protein IFM89_024136 [Coptis chinensis]|uniref:Late embryogenesis abundant protein LEA-2 subgroup domain-containing protein n=1 Tax=Coptis chinensis TaxID=261450 RepID=A0A835H896_9MAGN|nr:hypothetical protein IFM89_024136 [Coptis chinensis]
MASRPGPIGGQPISPQRRPMLVRCIVIGIVLTVVLVGFVVLVVWLAVRPQRLVYTVEDGKVHGFDLYKNHLNASFDFILKSYNPNHKISLYYDSIEVSVAYDDKIIAFDYVDPFHQPRHNVTRLEVKPMARSVPLMGSVSKNLRIEKSSGQIELAVLVKARIRFKVGIWKSSHHTLKVYCKPVGVQLDPSRKFETTYCDVNS